MVESGMVEGLSQEGGGRPELCVLLIGFTDQLCGEISGNSIS